MASIPPQFTYTTFLTSAGLNTEQALIYEALLKNGSLTVSKIAKNTGIERTLIYKIIEKLEEFGLVLKKDKVGKVAIFEASHPRKLQELAEIKEQQAISAKQTLENLIPILTSDFNLTTNKPTVQFFEGLDGAVLALKDSLKSTTEICSYINNEAVYKHFPSINEDYVDKRHSLQIPHRILSPNTDSEKKILQKEKTSALTEVRLMDIPSTFPAIVRIYEQSVCFQSLDPNKLVSVIIRDTTIASTMKTLFEAHWEKAGKLSSLG